MEDEGRRCLNPLCRRMMWNTGYRYASGEYCDEYCVSESRMFRSRLIEKSKDVSRGGGNFHQTTFPHKFLPITLILD